MQDKAIMVVSFGTSYRETCERTIEALEADFCARFPERRFYRAWTSKIIRRKLAAQGIIIDSVEDALDRMQKDGIKDLLVQTTHILPGEEYALTLNAVKEMRSAFSAVRIGAPLLSDQTDIAELARLLEDSFSQVECDSLLAFMGHGSGSLDAPVYEELENCFQRDGFANFCVGTVEFDPGFTPILERVRKEKPNKVYLTPLMVVAGDHANNDMAGDDPDSWRSQIAAEGIDTVCLLKGLGEYPAVRKMYIRHAEAAENV